MDFNSLGENSPVYIVRKKPFEYLTGKLKSKNIKQQNAYLPSLQPQSIDIVINVAGNDEVLPNIPNNMETVEYKGSYYSVSPEGIQNAVANMMQMAKSNLDEQDYYKTILDEGEKVMERLNPQYAEGKRQARTIKDLQERADAQDKKLDEILSFMRSLGDSSAKK
jgi:hypothetical protein